jgi:predicted kinase
VTIEKARYKVVIAHLIHGFVGTGKTTYAVKLEKEVPAIRFSIDEWIILLYGQNPHKESFPEHYSRVEALIWQVASRCLLLGQDVVMDFGFWSRVSRDAARQRVRDTGADSILYWVSCGEDTMRERVLHRTAALPGHALYIDDSAIREFYQRFEPLGDDEPHRLVSTDG